MAQCLDHRVARFRDGGDFGNLLFGPPKLDEIRSLVEDLLDRRPDDFTTSICERILSELEAAASFVHRFEIEPPPATIELPHSWITSTRVFDWLGGALTGRSLELVDNLGLELVDAARVMLEIVELAQNPPI